MKFYVLLTVALASVLAVSACGASAETLNNRGNDAFANQDYEAALSAYRQAEDQSPELAQPHYNAANALYRTQNFEQAQQEIAQVLAKDDGTLATDSTYNLGNTYFQAGQFEPAIEAYKETLRLNPDDVQAKHNLELALKQIEQQEQEQQEQQQQENQNQQDQQQQENRQNSNQSPENQDQPQENQQNQDSSGNEQNQNSDQSQGKQENQNQPQEEQQNQGQPKNNQPDQDSQQNETQNQGQSQQESPTQNETDPLNQRISRKTAAPNPAPRSPTNRPRHPKAGKRKPWKG
ncbi:MAG: tetratricopeptide repeat protein [Chloroflexi bacterium]|nr:MAG: tetratricopeptide repeat protein [Chloroflexota bacterium]